MKQVKNLVLYTFYITMLLQMSSCVKEVDYKSITETLNEGNLSKIMNASDDGYATYYIRTFKISKSAQYVNEAVPKSKITDSESIRGCIQINNAVSYGNAARSVEEDIDYKETKDSNIENRYKKQDLFKTEFKYCKNQFDTKNNEKLFSVFFAGKLQGLQKIIPVSCTYGADVPPSVFYKLKRNEFEKIINNNFNIQYDKFIEATILIRFHYRTGEEPKEIEEISIYINYDKENELCENINFHEFHCITFFRKEENKKTAKQDFYYYKNSFEKILGARKD